MEVTKGWRAGPLLAGLLLGRGGGPAEFVLARRVWVLRERMAAFSTDEDYNTKTKHMSLGVSLTRPRLWSPLARMGFRRRSGVSLMFGKLCFVSSTEERC